MALIAFGIQKAIAMGINELDFDNGDEEYKKHWVNKEYTIGTMELSTEKTAGKPHWEMSFVDRHEK